MDGRLLKALVTSAALVLVAAACFTSPSVRPCRIECGEGGSCPSGTSCQSNGFCHASSDIGVECSNAVDASADSIDSGSSDANDSSDASVMSGLVLRAISFGGLTDDMVNSVRPRPGGGLILGGSYHGPVSFGGKTLPALGNLDGFVATLTPTLGEDWALGFGASASDAVTRSVAAASDGIRAVGYVDGNVDFGKGPAPCESFVASYDDDAAGSFSWSDCLVTGSNANHLVVDTANKSVFTGLYTGSAVMGGRMITSNGDQDMYVIKRSETTVDWMIGHGGTLHDRGEGIAVDSADNVYATGSYSGTANFGGNDFTTAASGGFVAKYASADGAHIWSVGFTGGFSSGRSMGVLSPSDDVIVAGSMGGTVNFGLGDETGVMFVARLRASDGMLLWVEPIKKGGSSSGSLAEIVISPTGDIYVVGQFNGTLEIGSEMITSMSDDIFLIKYDASGVAKWSRALGGAGSESPMAVTLSAAGDRLFIAGHFDAQVDFDGHVIDTNGMKDAFVLELTP